MTKEEKCRNSQKGRKVIHKDNVEKRVFKEEVDYYISQGWKLGQKESHIKNTSISHVGMTPWNKSLTGDIDPRVKKQGGETSFKKGHSPWNKGLNAEDDIRVKNNTLKSTETKILRYGSASCNYGKTLSAEHRRKIGIAVSGLNNGVHKLTPEQKQQRVDKAIQTMISKGNFPSSKKENEFFNTLSTLLEGKTILRQYKDDRYPFYCDFYVIEDDTFIEVNAHWTHGGRPYDANDPFCTAQLNEWKEKSKTSNFYSVAIQTWTVRDVKKLECAKKNNLNYIVIY